jgi:hypothetical protein
MPGDRRSDLADSMLVPAGNTANFAVFYDTAAPNGAALAADVLNRCESDRTKLGAIWPPGTQAPIGIQVTIVAGAGGAFHAGANVTLYVNNNSDAFGVQSLLVAEVDEMFMSNQEAALGKGFNPGSSHGEGLSRVLAAALYPDIAGRWAVGVPWLDADPRPDWVSATEPTDQDGLSYGCASLFLNYLHYQRGFTWQEIVAAADNTLALVAQNLGVHTEPADFFAVLARHYPVGTPVNPAGLPQDSEGLPIDDLFPLSCLYLRHNLNDDGTSHTGPLASSPDIIAKNAPVANPQATYSTAASIASDAESDPDVIDGQDNFVYLRVWNLGADATNITATAYWAPPATLVTPNMWNLIGQANYADVPAERVVEVSAPGITWSSADIPGPGHYCFIATVGSVDDPAPTPAAFPTFDAFMAYIEANNNITWRNFNVVSPGGWAPRIHRFPEFVALPFLITGAWDQRRAFNLELEADLPVDESHLRLQVPAWFARNLEPAPIDFEEHHDNDTDPDEPLQAHIILKSEGPHPLGRIELPAGTRIRSHLLVRLPRNRLAQHHDLTVRQTVGSVDVGSITWRLLPTK